VAEAIRGGQEPVFDNADDALIYAFAQQLFETQRVAQPLYERAITRFGLEVTVNLVALLGYYGLVAMTLNVFEMRAQGQVDLPFAQP